MLLCGAVIAAPAWAQSLDEQWKFTAVIYAYLPKISGSTTFPSGITASFGVYPSSYISNLKFAFMGAAQAEKRSWVFFTDLIYTDLGGSKAQTQDLSISGAPIPVGVTADANLKITATLWTIAGGYQFVKTPEWLLEFFGGARDLVMSQTLSYNLSANVGPIVGNLRQGESNININNWDGIVGTKGRFMFGDKREWFVPYYVDVGTGTSQKTWQLYGGLGYAMSWGELVGVWRNIDYKFKDPSNPSLKMNGPAVGVWLHW